MPRWFGRTCMPSWSARNLRTSSAEAPWPCAATARKVASPSDTRAVFGAARRPRRPWRGGRAVSLGFCRGRAARRLPSGFCEARQHPLGSLQFSELLGQFRPFVVDLGEPLGKPLPFLCDVVEGGHFLSN